jgi:hypothetical protein
MGEQLAPRLETAATSSDLVARARCPPPARTDPPARAGGASFAVTAGPSLARKLKRFWNVVESVLPLDSTHSNRRGQDLFRSNKKPSI